MDDAEEQAAAAVVALGFELRDQVAAAACDRLERGHGQQEGLVGRELVVEQQELDFGPRAEGAAFVAVDVQRLLAAEDAHHESARQADRLDGQAEAAGDQQEHEAERNRDAAALGQDMRQERRLRRRERLLRPAEAFFAVEHAAEQAAFRADVQGLCNQLAGPGAQLIEFFPVGAVGQLWVVDTLQQEAGFFEVDVPGLKVLDQCLGRGFRGAELGQHG